MTTIAEWYITNLLIGAAGAVNQAIIPAIIADVFYVHQRASMNAIYVGAQCVGNYIGPVATGYIVTAQGWPWAFWWCAIFWGATTLIVTFGLEETKWHPSADLALENLRDNTEGSLCAEPHSFTDKEVADKGACNTTEDTPGSESLMGTVEPTESYLARPPTMDPSVTLRSWRQRFAFITRGGNLPQGLDILRDVYKPFQLLLIFPAISFCGLQMAIAILCLAVVTVTQGDVYPLAPYNFSPVGVGNMNIPPFIGTIFGSILGGPFTDIFILAIAKRRRGAYQPETRLWLFIAPALGLISGLLLYGLTISKGIAWITNAVGAGIIGFGVAAVMDIAMTYAQDSYHH
ncbi:hypothetical protein LTR41_011847, partial [Exophiala xenobiotica]